MTRETFEGLLEAFLSRQPFQVFVVQMNNGQRHEIDHPRSVVYRDGFAIYISPGGIPIYFDHEGVLQILDARKDAITT